MSLYPNLNDMNMDQPKPKPSAPTAMVSMAPTAPLYPSLTDYMGLEFSETFLAANMPEYSKLARPEPTKLVPTVGMQRALVDHNPLRTITLCKDKDGKIGLRVKDINGGIFVCLVVEGGPAALAGIRFGDQIISINHDFVAGMSVSQVHDIFKRCPVNGINVVKRDRPFERAIPLKKDKNGCVGFQFKNGKITSLVKDTIAVAMGLLTDHQILEVDGVNVVGLKDKEIAKIIEKGEDIVTITIIPSYIYEHMIKKMSGSLLKNMMDHSIPTM